MISMDITVKFFVNFRDADRVGKSEIENVNYFSALPQRLFAKYGESLSGQLLEEKNLRDTAIVFVNGKSISLMDDINTKLNDGDGVAIFPPDTGG